MLFCCIMRHSSKDGGNIASGGAFGSFGRSHLPFRVESARTKNPCVMWGRLSYGSLKDGKKLCNSKIIDTSAQLQYTGDNNLRQGKLGDDVKMKGQEK